MISAPLPKRFKCTGKTPLLTSFALGGGERAMYRANTDVCRRGAAARLTTSEPMKVQQVRPGDLGSLFAALLLVAIHLTQERRVLMVLGTKEPSSPMEKQEGKGRVMPSLPTPGGNPNPEKKKAAVGRDKRAGEGRGLFARWWVEGLLCSAVLVSGSEGGVSLMVPFSVKLLGSC